MTTTTKQPEISTILPPEARERLMRAARTPIPPGDPLARIRAIEEAALMARLVRPKLFQR